MTIAIATTVRTRLRTIVEGFVWLLLAAMAAETWLLAGLAIPCRVVGDSMAEGLLGTHREILCADCGCRFRCGVDPRSVRSQAVCPNCGYPSNDLQSLAVIQGDRLLIDRTAFALRQPRRWEVAALRHPQRANDILVKRVVGLPGESIEIRDGDVYVDGQIQRKNLAQQHALAILVHDADCRPTLEPTARPRWQGEGPDSRWESADAGFSHPCYGGEETIDWLIYHHQRRLSDGKTVEEPVIDLCGYNQSQPRRDEEIHIMADLLLSFRLEPAGFGTFFVRATDGNDTFEVRLRFLEKELETWQYEAFHDGKPLPEASGSEKHAGRLLVEVSLIDQQFMLALDGRTVVAVPYQRLGFPPSPRPFALGVQGLGAKIHGLRVFRDVYYTRPILARPNPTPAKPVHLGGDEYYVLGDNSPISDDSRTWTDGGAIVAKLLVGKPLVAIPSLEVTPCRDWHFQVPNLRRIQYIQ